MGKKKYLFKNDPDYSLMATTPMNLTNVKEIFKRMLYLKNLDDVYFIKDDELEFFRSYLKDSNKELNFVVAPHTKYRYGVYGRRNRN